MTVRESALNQAGKELVYGNPSGEHIKMEKVGPGEWAGMRDNATFYNIHKSGSYPISYNIKVLKDGILLTIEPDTRLHGLFDYSRKQEIMFEVDGKPKTIKFTSSLRDPSAVIVDVSIEDRRGKELRSVMSNHEALLNLKDGSLEGRLADPETGDSIEFGGDIKVTKRTQGAVLNRLTTVLETTYDMETGKLLSAKCDTFSKRTEITNIGRNKRAFKEERETTVFAQPPETVNLEEEAGNMRAFFSQDEARKEAERVRSLQR